MESDERTRDNLTRKNLRSIIVVWPCSGFVVKIRDNGCKVSSNAVYANTARQ